MEKTKIIWIVVILIVIVAGLYVWSHFYRKQTVPVERAATAEVKQTLDALTPPPQKVPAGLTGEQNKALESLSTPVNKPTAESVDQTNAILKSLEAR